MEHRNTVRFINKHYTNDTTADEFWSIHYPPCYHVMTRWKVFQMWFCKLWTMKHLLKLWKSKDGEKNLPESCTEVGEKTGYKLTMKLRKILFTLTVKRWNLPDSPTSPNWLTIIKIMLLSCSLQLTNLWIPPNPPLMSFSLRPNEMNFSFFF